VSSLKNFASNVRRLRVARGLTQEELAERAQTGYKHLQRIEGGVAKGLHFRTLDKFSKALGVEAWELVCPISGPRIIKKSR
jgi:transcriptional regulator with XRE-family HTH domain